MVLSALLLGLASPAATAEATTLVQADTPRLEGWSRSAYYQGTVARNNNCNALNCNDWAGLQWRAWGVWKTRASATRERSTTTGPFCTPPAHLRTVHQAVYGVAGQSGFDVGANVLGTGVNFGGSGTNMQRLYDNRYSSSIFGQTGLSSC